MGDIMSVRKRKWTTSKGEAKEAWIVDYVDQQGERHQPAPWSGEAFGTDDAPDQFFPRSIACGYVAGSGT
jgi:hypothetical protein